jgi:hypothetical protein
MASKKKNAITILGPTTLAEAGRFVPSTVFQEFSFFSEMKAREQEALVSEGKLLAQAMIAHGASRLEIGQRLANIQETLNPYSGAFARFLKTFHFTGRTGYRYIEGYQNAVGTLSEPIVKAAMARGMSIMGNSAKPLGKYSEAAKLLPPPKNPDAAEATRWLDQLEQTRQERRKKLIESGKKETVDAEESVQHDPQTLLQQTYRMFKNSWRVLPSRGRRRFLDGLVGMFLTEAGIGSAATFEPQAIPEEFRQGRGRPRLVREEAEAS